MALSYSVRRTELTNSNIGLLIIKLCHNILKTPNMFENHMISTRVTKDKGNLAVVECNCKVHGIERWLRNLDSEGNNTTFSQDASYITIFKRRFDLKAIIGTHEFAHRNWMLMEPNKSSHLTNDKVTVAGEYCAGQKWHNQAIM